MDAKTYTQAMNRAAEDARRRRDERYGELEAQERIWGHVPREWIRCLEFARVSREDMALLRKYADTCSVSDILDTMGIHGALSASLLAPVAPGMRIVGQAVTQRNLPERKTVTRGFLDREYIGMSTKDIGYLAQEGDVLVVDNSGVPDVSCMGGMACKGYHARGIAGAVVWGGVRDIAAIREDGFPVWSRGQTCVTGKFRIFAAEINGPIAVASVLVCPGDLIVADDSGVCVVPCENIAALLEKLKKTAEGEENMRKMIDNGAHMRQLREIDRADYR